MAGIENFAAILNGMSHDGAGQMGDLFSHLNSKGSSAYARFCNHATPQQSVALATWFNTATPEQVRRAAQWINSGKAGSPQTFLDGLNQLTNGGAPDDRDLPGKWWQFWKRESGTRPAAVRQAELAANPQAEADPPLGTSSSELPQFRTCSRDQGATWELSGKWLDELFPGRTSIEVLKQLDLAEYFSNSKKVFEWTIAYLHHPDPEIVGQTIQATAPYSQIATVETYAYLVTHGDQSIEDVAIRHFWHAVKVDSFNLFFNILGSSGFLPSGVNAGRARRALRRIDTQCPPTYPESARQRFRELGSEHFGPGLFQDQATTRVASKESLAKYKETTHQELMGRRTTYEVHSAASREDALAFLESRAISQDLYFVVVETPDGNWCKDKNGLYRE